MRTHISLLLLAAGLVACGDGAGRDPAAPAVAEAPVRASLPDELIGTWTARIPPSALPERPNELNEASSRWQLKILPDGGTDGAPSFTVLNGSDEVGAIFSPTGVTASGERLKLTDPSEDCNGGPATTEFSYSVEGERLTLQSPVADCPSKLMEAILTSRSWKRAG